MDDMQAIIIEGERFDWKAAHDEIDQNKLWETRPEYAAAMSDPGCCSCPRCHRHYWAEGVRLECPACHAQFETNWWAMLSWGVQHGHRRQKGYSFNEWLRANDYHWQTGHYRSAVFRWGVANPDCSLNFRAVFKMTDWISVWDNGAQYIKEGEMVGGKIIGVAIHEDRTALLNVQGTGGEKKDSCAVRCRTVPNVELREGDSVWWQAGKVYWTPGRDRRDYPRRGERPEDVPLEKIGYSH